ncbi:hypothetical protein [Agarivorans sp. Alg241-V36]|uniref:hypothetical protein n=1 Tax=Agarivorans sp. Alg241-V36 TaxID=2305992 RepID=UPI0013D0FF7F|nr:hypothetical protein [Agarivorans sp. Alg241-V36]
MIIKPIYEILPSLYLAAGSSSVIWVDSTLGVAGGVLLFCLGSLIWVMRSNFRRLDQATHAGKRFNIPESLYEFMPFLFIGLALSLASTQQSIAAYAIAALCLYRGCSLLYMRHRYRRQVWQKVPSSVKTSN